MTHNFYLKLFILFKNNIIQKYLFKMSHSLTENIEDKNKFTLLIDALTPGFLDQANALIRAGVDLNVIDKDGRTALMIALVYGRLDQANAFIDAGVDLNVTDKDGRTAYDCFIQWFSRNYQKA